MTRKRASDDNLGELHQKLAEHFLNYIRNAQPCETCGCTGLDPRVLGHAVKLLKDNGIVALATPKSPLGELAASLPFLSDEERASLVNPSEDE